MARIFTVAALAAAGLAAGGCMGTGPELSAEFNPTVYSVNQPVVQRTDYVFDLAPGAGAAELERLDGWFQSIELGYGDRISIDSAGYGDPRTRAAVAGVAEAYGLLLSEGAPVTAGSGGGVRVIVSRATASVPGCPNWDPSEIGARVTTSPNYGCAYNSNLAAMIANPADLVSGQVGATSVDAATSSKAIKTYRTKEPTGAGALKKENTQGGSGGSK